jgi:hypothetical protein
MPICGPAWRTTANSAAGTSIAVTRPHGPRGRLAREEDRRLAALVGEDLGLVDAATRASGGDVLGSQGSVQFRECPLIPGKDADDVHDLRDRGCRHGGSVTVPDRRGGRRALQQAAESGHGILGAGEAGLQAGQMGGDQPAARLGIGSGQDRVDLLQRHIEVPEPADHLGGGDLRSAVAPIPGVPGRHRPAPAGRLQSQASLDGFSGRERPPPGTDTPRESPPMTSDATALPPIARGARTEGWADSAIQAQAEISAQNGVMPLRSRQRGHRGCGCGAIISSVGIGAPPRRLCRQR